MENTKDFLRLAAPYVLGLVRIVVAALFMQHGGQKLIGFPASDRPSPDAFTLGWIAGVLELYGGGLLLIGLGVRPVAFLLSGMMAVAYFMAHASRSLFPVLNGGELAALYCFIFLHFVFAGGGAFSLDSQFRRREP